MKIGILKQIKFKHKIIYICLITAIFVLLIIKFIILPVIDDIKTVRAEIIDQKIDLERKITLERNKNQLIDNINTIEPRLIEFEKFFINKNKELEFITTMEGLAEKNTVSQKLSLDLNKAKKFNDYSIIPISLNLNGKYVDIIKYLINLEEINYYININSINITKTSSNANTSSVNATINANSYWK